jgi:hypothetical protein
MENINITRTVQVHTAEEISAHLTSATPECWSGIAGVTIHTVRGQFGEDSREWGIRGAYTSSITTAVEWVRAAEIADAMGDRFFCSRST